MKKAVCWFFGISFASATIAGIATVMDSLSASEKASNLAATLACALIAFFLIRTALKPKTLSKKEKKELAERLAQQEKQRRIDEINATVTLPIVQRVHSIILKPGEICHYQVSAQTMVVKNQVVGHEGGYRGVSVRVAKGLTLHTGGSRGQSIRQDVPYYYPGLFTMTNQRIIMTGEKGFDNSINKLTALTTYTDGVGLQFGRTTYTILMDEPQWIQKILDLLQSGASTETVIQHHK